MGAVAAGAVVAAVEEGAAVVVDWAGVVVVDELHPARVRLDTTIIAINRMKNLRHI